MLLRFRTLWPHALNDIGAFVCILPAQVCELVHFLTRPGRERGCRERGCWKLFRERSLRPYSHR